MMAQEESFTLETSGVLVPVGNQGQCQCCYAFVGTACVSSLFARLRMGQPLVRLSVQELVDCLHISYAPRSFDVDDHDCYLNNYNNTFRYMSTRGVSLEEDYPYQGRRRQPQNTSNNRKMRIDGFFRVANLRWSEDDINSQIKFQPLAGAILNCHSVRNFRGAGIYMGIGANEKGEGLHALQIIGYGVENGVKYFKILNSWGENWGNNGTAKIRRDLILNLSFPYGATLDEKVGVGRQSASKVKNQKEHDSSSKIGKDKSADSSKKDDQPSSSIIKQKGQSKTQKVGQKRSRSLDDIETNECLGNKGGCWQDKAANLTACKDTFRGRASKCPIIGDGYTLCEASGALRCQVSDGGCWKETRNSWTFSACVDDHTEGCKCPPGFSWDGVKSCEECFFKLKALNAQNAGAAAVLVADNRVEPLITMDNPEEEDAQPHYLQNVTVPSAIISKALGDDVKNALSEGKMVNINLDWREALPNPDERVEFEFWTNSNHKSGPKFKSQIEFVKNLKGVAQILEQKVYTQFKPHYITWYCPEAFILSKQCKSQYINSGRFCAPDPEQDFIWGYDGKDVIVQNLRQACFFKLAIESGKSWLWWDTVTDFAISSPMKEKYTKECADQVIQSLEFTGKDVKQIDRCVGDPEAVVDNPVLKAEQEAQIGKGSRGDVTILPTLAINNRQYRGKLDKSAVLKAICSGLQDTTEPAVCLSADVGTNECLENNGGCWQDKAANLTACKEVKFVGDGFTLCEASGALRCEDDHTKGSKCPSGFSGDGVKSYEGGF